MRGAHCQIGAAQVSSHLVAVQSPMLNPGRNPLSTLAPSISVRFAARLALALAMAILLCACGRSDAPTPESATATIDQTTEVAPETVAATAPETTVEASTLPLAQATEGGTIPIPAATRGPLEETIERLFLDSLPFPLAPESAGLGINGVALLPASVNSDTPATWLVHTVGMRDFSTNQVHRVNIYQQAGEHVVAEVARLNLGVETFGADNPGSPDYLAPNAASQVSIEPTSLWFAIEGGVGAHAGVFNLLRFDPATRQLSMALAANSPSPGAASVQDVNDDGFGEVIVNATDPYVFCYACGVRLAQRLLYRWNGSDIEQVALRESAGVDDGEAAESNTHLLELARAGLWKDVEGELTEAESIAGSIAGSIAESGSNFAWNLALLRINAEAKRAASQDAATPFPLLVHLFYGDYKSAGDVLRAWPANELFATPSALISGTVAAGWEETLANWIERSTAPALAYDPGIADAWLARAFGAWLIGNVSESGAWLEQAQAINPGDPFLVAALEQMAAPEAEGVPHLTALTPVEVRSGPGNSFPILLTLQPGDVVTITGRFGATPDLWWQIPVRDGESSGWVHADEARASAYMTDHVPEVVAPAQVAPVAQQGRILFSAESRNGVASLYEIAVAPAATPLLLLDDARQPALRAQGDIIAFASDRPDMLGIGGINLQTGERLRYTFNLEDMLPRWNATGDQLLFSSTREGDRRARIYRIFAEGAVSSQTLRLGSDADWHMQSGAVIFRGCDTTGNNCGLWTMQSDGTGSLPLTSNPGDARPRWSPDGSRVLFMSDQRDGNWELYEVSVADGVVTRLTDTPGEDGLPVYNAAGDAIAWMHRDENGWTLLTRQLAGGNENVLHSFGADFSNWLDQGLDWTE